MKCQLCQKRKGKHEHFVDWAKTKLLLCEKCRRAECPTAAEQESDALESERYAEFQAESGAGCFDLP